MPRQTDVVATSIRIGQRFQGPTGSGQGGWTAHRFAGAIGTPVDVSIRAPIPLDTDLRVVADPDSGGWWLVAHEGSGGAPVMTAVARDAIDVTTSPVSIGDVRAGRMARRGRSRVGRSQARCLFGGFRRRWHVRRQVDESVGRGRLTPVSAVGARR